MKSAYPEVNKNIINGIDEWVEIDREAYWYYLEVLPPAAMHDDWFMVGELNFCLTDNRGVRLVCKQEGDRYFAKLMTVQQYCSRDTKKEDYLSLVPDSVKSLYAAQSSDRTERGE